MITHTDNRHYGVSVVDSTLTIDTINQVDGINPSSILSYIPTVHDLSDQCDGANTVFTLDPPMAQGTQGICLVFLDGQALSRSLVIDEPDFYINSNLQQITFFTDITHLPPPQGSQLLVVYVEDNNPLP